MASRGFAHQQNPGEMLSRQKLEQHSQLNLCIPKKKTHMELHGFPAHDVHISGVLGSIELQLQILKPQTKLHHPNDYHWTVLMPIQRGIPIAMFDNQRVQCLPGKASRCQGRFQWPAYTFTSPVRTPVWTHCLGKTMEKPTIRLLPQVWASCKNQTSCWCLGSGFRQCPEEKAAPAKMFRLWDFKL